MKKFQLFLILFFLYSCNVTNLQKATLDGPSQQPPIHITDGNENQDVVFRINVSNNIDNKIKLNTGSHSKVNAQGEYYVEPVEDEDYYLEADNVNVFDFEGNNLNWKMPKYLYNFEFELHRKFFAVVMGLNYSSIDATKYLGFNGGFAFYYPAEKTAWRFDYNFGINRLKYEIEYINRESRVFSDWDYSVYFFNSSGHQTSRKHELSFTFNTKNDELPIDYFFNIGFGVQNVLSVENEDEMFDNINYNDQYARIGVGFYKNIFSNQRIIIGYRFVYHPDQYEHYNHSNLILQLDLFR